VVRRLIREVLVRLLSRLALGTAALLTAGAGTALAAPASAPAVTGTPMVAAPSILWTVAGAPKGHGDAPTPSPATSATNNLIYHGGAVLHHPHVYVTFWGTEWKNGFTQTAGGQTYTAKTIQNYEASFFASVGGTAWHGVQSQFCDNIAPGSLDCSSNPYAQFIANEKNLLKGVWVDGSAAPATIVTSGLATNLVSDPIASEAVKSAQHFGPYDPEGVYFVFTPPGHTATAYGTVYCAYHSEVTNVGGHGLKYSFMPYTPEQGAGCGGNSVNATNDAFGHGYLDSYSLAGGHEFEEAVTDPDAFPTQDGWNDASTSENGDKCAYFHAANLTVPTDKHHSRYWAVQPMWSNEANGGTGGCAMKRGTGAFPVPSTVPGT
jgi:hypothetical protein